MLSAFKLDGRRLVRLDLDLDLDLDQAGEEESENIQSAVWVDLVEPEDHERNYIWQKLGQSLATRPSLDDIEASARYFEDDDGLHVHSFFYYQDADDRASNATVAFTIREGRLYTLRERELPAFRLYRMRARGQSLINGTAHEILLDLFETKIEQLADEIENVYSGLEALSRIIFEGKHGEDFDQALSTLAELEDVGWKVRLCLMDSQRALSFLVRKAGVGHDQSIQARAILQDIESIIPHNEAMFQKVNFLLQSAMGSINIEQNRIIKIFSVVSVVFLPPTLIASSYGMNFARMPELQLSFGYPMALLMMLAAGLAPYLYFKHRGWL